MSEFEIIDVHVHLSRTIEEDIRYHPVPGRRICDRYATPERAIEFMDMEGISKMVFLTLPPKQYRLPLAEKAKLLELPDEQRIQEEERINQQIGPLMREINEWGCEVGKRIPRLIPFICIAKELGGAEGMVQELVTRASQGARGVKLHPGEFSLFPDDEEMWPVYDKCQEMGLPIIADSSTFSYIQLVSIAAKATVLHTSSWSQMPKDEINYGEPERFAPVLEAFPRLTLILAHLGAAWWDERIELANKFPNVYFDTSQGFTAPDDISFHPHRGLAEVDTVRVMRKIGVDRIMFGTDFPGIPFLPQLEQILRLPLTDEEKRMILSDNAKRILRT